MRGSRWRVLVALAALLVAPAGLSGAEDRTDVVRLRNGDRITGEVVRLDRGRLEFKTDDEGTIYFEWEKVVGLDAARQFEVATSDGRWFLGTVSTAGSGGSIVVAAAGGPVVLAIADVTQIVPIGESFWKKLDGSFDVGFSYTKSSQIAQLNVNTSTVYRRPRFEGRLTASGTLTAEEGSERDDRGIVQLSYVRYRGERLFVVAAAGFENNESLGIRLRSQVGVAVGPRLVNTNRAKVSVSGGISVNDERPVNATATQNVEGLGKVLASYYSYDRPRTNIDVSFQYYPSLSDFGRQRIQFDAATKREVWKDVFVALNVFDSFDSRPPDPAAHKNDVGVVFSFGWSY